jgi:hypothetical protein
MGRNFKAMTVGRLDSPETLIPPRKYYDEYISREIDKGVSEFDVFRYALANRMNVLIEGPTGPGKTSACLAFAALHDMPFYAIQSNAGAEPSQIFGRMVQSEAGIWQFQDGGLTALMRMSQKRPCFLLVNEINFMLAKIATVLFSLLDKRRSISLVDNRGEVLEAGNLLIVADMNPDYTGTRQLNEALLNRFPIRMVFDYDPAIEVKLVKSASLLRAAQQLRTQYIRGEHNTPVSTNSLMEFEKLANDFSVQFAINNFKHMFTAEYREAVNSVFVLEKINIEREYGVSTDSNDLDPDQLLEESVKNQRVNLSDIGVNTDTLPVEEYMKLRKSGVVK